MVYPFLFPQMMPGLWMLVFVSSFCIFVSLMTTWSKSYYLENCESSISIKSELKKVSYFL